MAVQVGIADFLEKVGKLSKNSDKITALKYNDSLPLRIILQGAYDPSVIWELPPGEPPYRPNQLVDQEGVLIREVEKLRYYIRGFYNLTPIKRETMFLELLERLAPKDASLLCAIKDKKPIKGISLNIVKEAFPDMIAEKNFLKESIEISKEEPNMDIAGID